MARLNTGFTAGGDIYPCRFCKNSTVTDRYVLQAGANEEGIYVAQEATHDTPGLTGAGTKAAAADQTVYVWEQGDDALVECGGTVTKGAKVKADTDGKAVVALTTGTTMQWVLGYALESGVSGSKILVKLHAMPYYPALA